MTILIREVRERIDAQVANHAVKKLCWLWRRLSATGGLPDLAELRAACSEAFADDLSLVDATEDDDYLYLSEGSNVVAATEFDLSGLRLSKLPGPVGELLKAKFDDAITAEQPVYFAHRALLAKKVNYWERLVLPARSDAGAKGLVLFSMPLSVQRLNLESIVETSAEGMLFFRKVDSGADAQFELMCETANSAAGRILERDEAAFIGVEIRRALPGGLGDELFELIEAALASGTPVRKQIRLTWQSSPRDLLVNVGPTLQGAAVMLHDVSELTRVQEALRWSERRFQDFAETSGDWFWEMDADLRFTYMSDRVEKHTGRSVAWHIGKTRQMLADPDTNRAAWEAHLDDLRHRRPYRNFRYFRRREDGSKQWFSTSGRPFYASDGAFMGYRGVATDVTRQVEAEQALVKSEREAVARKRELEQLNEQKDKLFSIIGHDLRSPFSTVIGYTELLVSGADSLSREQVTEFANSALQSGHHAFRILEDILQWARLCMNRHAMEPTTIDLCEVVADNLCGIDALANAKGIRLLHEVAPDLQVHADKTMLDTILRNLLSNAVKFTPDDGEINVRAELRGEQVEIAVADTGVGISPQRLEVLFELNRTHSTAGTRREEGTGFGLHICRELVCQMGGELWAESEQGKGSTFSLRLPSAESVAGAAKAGTGPGSDDDQAAAVSA